MARRRGTKKREVLPDPIYKDTLVTKFINSLMYSGKKSVAEGIFYKTLDLIRSDELWNQIKKTMPNFNETSIYTIFDLANKIANVQQNKLFNLPEMMFTPKDRW